MVTPALIKSYEYSIKVLQWIDGNPNEYYNRMTIQPIEKGNFVQFTNDKDNNYTLKINIGKIVNVSYVPNDVNLGDEIKLELTYSFVMDVSLINSVEKKQTLILKIRGVEKDKIVNLLINLRNVETQSFYWFKVEKMGEKRYDIYPLIPFYGFDEQLVWYNMIVFENMGTRAVKFLQAITNSRILIYNYDTHEGKLFAFQSFDTIEIRTASENNVYTYNSETGVFTEPVSPSEFKSLKFPKTVEFSSEGKEVFTFTPLEEEGKLLEIVKQLGDQIGSPKKVLETRYKSDSRVSKGEHRSIKCKNCGENVLVNSRFCNHCGERMTPICSKCNHENPMGSEYCSNCGFVLN